MKQIHDGESGDVCVGDILVCFCLDADKGSSTCDKLSCLLMCN